MSEPKLISPLLDNLAMGDPISDCGGIRICPAMNQETGDKYIVKIISNPATPAQLDALVLTGAYTDRDQALSYYETVSKDILAEAEILSKLATLDGFVAGCGSQLIAAEDGSGYDVYLLAPYRKSLDRYWTKQPMTHLNALNLGLDLCSALTVCRRCGYMYVTLSPENIYYSEDKGFRIGDIGFVALDSLKYASLPDRYRNPYTAPEIADAFANLNTGMDVYALGAILYQIFNGGVLPSMDGGNLPAPEFADYEIAEIILKACAKKPEDRWEDPAQMGHALVDYMQRNGAHDTPIVPVVVAPVAEEVTNTIIVETETATTPMEQVAETENTTTQVPVEDNPEVPVAAASLPIDDEPSVEDVADAENVQITEEVSEMLNQADELIAHEAPAPVIPPEPVDVQLPEISAEDQSQDAEKDTSAEETAQSGATTDSEETDTQDDQQNKEANNSESTVVPSEYYDDEYDYAPGKKSHWIRNTILVLLLIGLLTGGFLFYKMYYLQHIDSITLSGDDLSLTVQVNTQADESLLTVICYDAYGSQFQSPVINGKAYFPELLPNTAYTVKIEISGFHSLTGEIAKNYPTPPQTKIVKFTALTGAADGSAVLDFQIEGPDPQEWIIRRTAADEEAQDYTFSGHSFLFTDLIVGKEYTFELLSPESKQIVGTTKITHTASKVIKAVNPMITGFQDGRLSVTWEVPEGSQVSGWNVRCYNEKGYDKLISVTEPSAVFEGVIANDPYTIEIVADGMQDGVPVFVPENAIVINNLKAETTTGKNDIMNLKLTWINVSNPPEGGWILRYSVDGSEIKEVTSTNADSITLTPYIPDCAYTFTLLTADGQKVIGGTASLKADKAANFNRFSVKSSQLKVDMCKTPSKSNWKRADLQKTDYTTTFKVGVKASFAVKIDKKGTYGVSRDKFYVTYVIRDKNGTVVGFSTKETTWTALWKKNEGEFDLPALPQTAGDYNVTVYFNSTVAWKQSFKVK